MREKIENFLLQRSTREILLFKLCFLSLCILFAWKTLIEEATQRFFSRTPSQESSLPLPFLGYFDSQELLTKTAKLINSSQSDISKESFTLKIQGKIQDDKLFSLLNTLKNYPTLQIDTLSFDIQENFSLTLSGENFQTYAHSSALLPTIAPLTSPWKKTLSAISPLTLEALLNQKAKINGHWIKLGEQVSGYTLKEIQKDCIILQNTTGSLTLYLRERILK